MKGIVLAGGLGSRLKPLTRVTNKHLLPVYNKPMIFYPIETLVRAGIRDIIVITGGNMAGAFLELLGNGEDFGLKSLRYGYQKGEGGIAEALGLARDFAQGERIVVILGDNILEDKITPYVESFERQKSGAKILLKEVDDAERFGVAEIGIDHIISIAEKPKSPKSKFAVTGVYMYDEKVFDFIAGLKPSNRGELEITDVNNRYLKRNELTYDILPGFWTDAGTFDSLLRANYLMAAKQKEVHA